MIVSLIVAAAENDVIGRDQSIPWHLPDDLKRFRRLTKGHHIVMGRRTHESIGRPLPRRENLVLSRGRIAIPGCRVVASLDEALAVARAAGEDEVFLIGGAGVYEEGLTRADRIHLTRVHAQVEGDTRFPALDPRDWRRIEAERHEADGTHAHPFTFETWARCAGPEAPARSE